MTALAETFKDAAGLALPTTLLAVALGAIALQALPLPPMPWAATTLPPQTVTLPPGEVTHRVEGHFFLDGAPQDPPIATTAIPKPLTIMKFQVSAADYARCVADGACQPAEPKHIGRGDVPVTGVNFADAEAYAVWLSRQTGQNWTLPTDAEWAYAAGDRLTDDALGLDDDGTNPAQRWLADYKQESQRKAEAQPTPMPLGHFGENENGLADIAGNVWEWTNTCHRRVHVDAFGTVLSEQPACTIRVLEGKHRASVSFFIRDAKSGGCSVGLPPDNLGFRLVRQPNWYENLLATVGL